MTKITPFLVSLSLLLLGGCGITSQPFTLDPGLDGCVHIQVDSLMGGPVHVENLTYHRVNEKCENVHPHKGVAE